MAMTKKEAAKRILDAVETADRIRSRTILAVVFGVIISIGIAALSSWYFGLAAVLVFGLLVQFAHERMSVSVQSSQLQGLKGLGWDEATVIDEACIERLKKILQV